MFLYGGGDSGMPIMKVAPDFASSVVTWFSGRVWLCVSTLAKRYLFESNLDRWCFQTYLHPCSKVSATLIDVLEKLLGPCRIGVVCQSLRKTICPYFDYAGDCGHKGTLIGVIFLQTAPENCGF